MNKDRNWNWENYRSKIFEFIGNNEDKFQEVMPFIKDCDDIVKKIIDRPLSYVGKRPQDFVVASLVTLSFRLSIIALIAGSGGYEDAVPILLRPLYEISLRLLQIEHKPIAASLGYLLGGVREEIRINESWLKYLRNTKEPIGKLEKNIKTLKNYAQIIVKEITAHGFSPEHVVKKYGKISPKGVANDFQIGEHFYNTNYGFMTGYVHARGFAFDDYYQEEPNQRLFILQPCDNNSGTIFDIFVSLIRNLNKAASIVGDADLEARTTEIYKGINKAISEG